MDGDAAGKRKGKRRQQRDAPIGQDEAGETRKDQHAPGCDQERKHARGANRRCHGRVECGWVGRGWNGRQRIGVEQAEAMEQLKPGFDRQDGQIGGVIEELLRLAIVHGERAVDHHEVHVSVAPVDYSKAEQEERYRQACDARGQPAPPTEKGQTVERIVSHAGRRPSHEGWCRKLGHAGGLLA